MTQAKNYNVGKVIKTPAELLNADEVLVKSVRMGKDSYTKLTPRQVKDLKFLTAYTKLKSELFFKLNK